MKVRRRTRRITCSYADSKENALCLGPLLCSLIREALEPHSEIRSWKSLSSYSNYNSISHRRFALTGSPISQFPIWMSISGKRDSVLDLRRATKTRDVFWSLRDAWEGIIIGCSVGESEVMVARVREAWWLWLISCRSTAVVRKVDLPWLARLWERRLDKFKFGFGPGNLCEKG